MGPLATLGMGVASDIAGGLVGKLFGGGTSANKQYNIWAQQARYSNKLATEFDASQIQRRVADAKLAGIHPLAGVGISPSSGPSISVGGISDTKSFPTGMGQNISRAVEAVATRDERAQATAMNGLSLERARLENELLRYQITNVARATTPSLPGSQSPLIAGQGDAHRRVVVVPDEVTASAKGDTGITAGSHPGFQEYDLGNGRTIQLPVGDGGVAEALEGLPVPYTYGKIAEMLYKRYDRYTPGYALAKLFKRKGGK